MQTPLNSRHVNEQRRSSAAVILIVITLTVSLIPVVYRGDAIISVDVVTVDEQGVPLADVQVAVKDELGRHFHTVVSDEGGRVHFLETVSPWSKRCVTALFSKPGFQNIRREYCMGFHDHQRIVLTLAD